jgi:hypothetical protein
MESRRPTTINRRLNQQYPPKAAVPRCEHVTFKAEVELAALSREQKD